MKRVNYRSFNQVFHRLFGMDQEGLKDLMEHTGALRHYARGEELFSPGQEVSHIYLVVEGKVKLFERTSHGEQGEVIINLFMPGDILGLTPVLKEHPYTRYGSALSDSLVFVWSKEGFYQAVEQYPKLLYPIFKQVELEIGQITSWAQHMVNNNTLERLAQAMLLLDHKFGHNSSGEIELEFTPQELASFIGATRTTVYRHLKVLGDLGWATLEHRHIRILNNRALAELAQVG